MSTLFEPVATTRSRRAASGLPGRYLATDLGTSAAPRSSASIGEALWSRSWCRTADLAVALISLFGIVVFSSSAVLPSDWSEFLGVRLSVTNVLQLVAFTTVWAIVLRMTGVYDEATAASGWKTLVSVVCGCALATISVFFVPYVSNTGLLGGATLPWLWAATAAGSVAIRIGVRTTAAVQRRKGVPRRLVLAGSGTRADALWQELRRHPTIRYELVAVADTPDAEVAPAFRDAPFVAISELDRFFMHTSIDDVFVALPMRSRYAEFEQVLRVCEDGGVHAHYLTDAFSPALARPRSATSGSYSVMSMHVVQHDWRLGVKRAVDVFGSAVGLLMLSPVLLGLALLVKLDSPGPAFFSQERYGFKKRRFRMHKFRTMVPDAEARQAELEGANEVEGPVFKIKRDPRITRIGGFLRKTSLDELPQLWNVLVGEMSLIGPRPLPMRDIERFDAPSLMRRFSVRPGVTGLWQVSGRSALSFDQWMALDLCYIDEWTLRLDAIILFRTIPAVLFSRGAH